MWLSTGDDSDGLGEAKEEKDENDVDVGSGAPAVLEVHIRSNPKESKIK